jgi:hypothetical protein
MLPFPILSQPCQHRFLIFSRYFLNPYSTLSQSFHSLNPVSNLSQSLAILSEIFLNAFLVFTRSCRNLYSVLSQTFHIPFSLNYFSLLPLSLLTPSSFFLNPFSQSFLIHFLILNACFLSRSWCNPLSILSQSFIDPIPIHFQSFLRPLSIFHMSAGTINDD